MVEDWEFVNFGMLYGIEWVSENQKVLVHDRKLWGSGTTDDYSNPEICCFIRAFCVWLVQTKIPYPIKECMLLIQTSVTTDWESESKSCICRFDVETSREKFRRPQVV